MADRAVRTARTCRGAFVLGAIGALAVIVVVFGGEAALSSTGFCLSCHSMSYPAAELRKSTHYGALGANPGCEDCHVPRGLANFHRAVATHLIDGARELVMEFRNDYSDVKKFDARRLENAQVARMNLKRWDSLTCRACHKAPQPPGADARTAHQTMRTHGATCIDCHQNLVHKKVPETDLDASLAQGRMVLKEE